MKHVYQFAKAALLPMVMLGTAVIADAAPRENAGKDYFRFAQKAKGLPEFGNNLNVLENNGPRKSAEIAPVMTLKGEFPYGFLDGPDGSVWFYTSDYLTEEVQVDGYYEGYTETITKGYTFTIYDSNLKKVGTVSDIITLSEDETRVAQVMLDACITKKFFNINDNYEIIVSIAFNKADYTVGMRSKAYSIGGAKNSDGYDVPVAEIPGYVVSAHNGAVDEWSENFYITFMTQSCDYSLDDHIEFLESCKYDLHIYSKAGWGGAMNHLADISLSETHLPGDQMNAPFFMTYSHDGDVWFALQQYEKRYYEDPAGSSENEAPMADNNLIITLYEVESSKLSERQVTKIPVVQSTKEKDLYTYYSIGNFGYAADIDYGNFLPDASKASFVVTKQVYATASDSEYRTSYHVYDAEGVEQRTIAEDVQGYTRLTDLDGYEPQYMLLLPDEAGTNYIFSFVNIYSGEVVAELPHIFEGYSMRGQLDRYPGGSSYLWGISVNDVLVDELGNAYEQIIWVDAAGAFIDHVDKINLGRNVAYATPYVDHDAMSPYLFNTDAEREYMYLVKRYITADGSETAEELVIGSTSGKNLFTLGSDATKGKLSSVSLVNADSNPQLNIIYSDEDYNITQDIYELPFSKFEAGGEGTLENPYIISSIGDLQMVSDNLSAHYVVGNDIDANGYVLRPIANGTFLGTIDGAGKTISNLVVGTDYYRSAIFGDLGENAEVKNLNFKNIKIKVGDKAQYVGVLAGEAVSSKIDNIHVDGLAIDGTSEAYVGGIIGHMVLYSELTSCSVKNGDYNMPAATVGGIVGVIRTSSVIKAASFSGKINGGYNVGGIVGGAGSAGDTVADCHVTADIVGVNNVGGVVGSSSRAQINRCYIEGTLEAVGPDKWSSACVGGVAGNLDGNYAEPEEVPVIAACVVNLTSMAGFEASKAPSFPAQHRTIHRIVGKTSKNEDASLGSEAAIANNYANAKLDLGDDGEIVAANSVEGESIKASDLTREFFESLGYVFGEETSAPWVISADNGNLELYFEANELSGVEDIMVEENVMALVGGQIVAKDCQIEVYTAGGILVAQGTDTVAVDNLTKGIYIAIATAPDNTRSTLKLAK